MTVAGTGVNGGERGAWGVRVMRGRGNYLAIWLICITLLGARVNRVLK